MSERQRTEISAELLASVRELAAEQGRSEAALLEEAVATYLLVRRPGISWEQIVSGNLGADVAQVYVEPTGGPERRHGGFPALLDRMSSRFGIDEDEAMRVAVEEQQAFRRERRERVER